MEKMCDDLYISAYAQKIMNCAAFPPSLPKNYRYTVLSVKRDLGGCIIYGYDQLLKAVIDAGYICLTSHRELSTFAIVNWDELKTAGFSYLSSTAPAIRVGDWHRFVYACLTRPAPYLRARDIEANFFPPGAVLALSTH